MPELPAIAGEDGNDDDDEEEEEVIDVDMDEIEEGVKADGGDHDADNRRISDIHNATRVPLLVSPRE